MWQVWDKAWYHHFSAGREALKNYLLLDHANDLSSLDLDLVTHGVATLEVGAQVRVDPVPSAFQATLVAPSVSLNPLETSPVDFEKDPKVPYVGLALLFCFILNECKVLLFLTLLIAWTSFNRFIRFHLLPYFYTLPCTLGSFVFSLLLDHSMSAP